MFPPGPPFDRGNSADVRRSSLVGIAGNAGSLRSHQKSANPPERIAPAIRHGAAPQTGAKPIPSGQIAPRVGVLLCPGGRLGSLGSPARLVMPTAGASPLPLRYWGRPESAPRQPRSDGTSQAFHSPAPGSGSGQELARPAGLWNT